MFNNSSKSYLTLFYIGLGLLLLSLFVMAYQVFFIALSGYIFFVFLNSCSQWISEKTKMTYPLSLGLFVSVLFLLFIGYWIYVVPVLSDQFQSFVEEAPKLKDKIISVLSPYMSEEMLKERISLKSLQEANITKTLIPKVNQLFAHFTFLTSTLLIVFILGLYFAITPQRYRDILLELFPKSAKDEADRVLDKISYNLRWWLVGRLASMAVVGTLTTIGLTLLGTDMAFSLGLFAGFASFIPNLGPILALIPAALVGLLESPMTSFYVVLLYMGIQIVESYLITPFITEKVVSLPPAWLILIQLIVSLVFGILGLAMAAPTLLILIVLMNEVISKKVFSDK